MPRVTREKVVGKRASRRTREQSSSVDALELAKAAIQAAINQKALDVCGLDIRGLSDVADYFVIASGTSERHISGIADKIESELKSIGEEPISVSGYRTSDWVILDYGNIVVHVLYEPARQFYNLDGLWKDAQKVPLPPELQSEARMLQTGMFR